MGNCIPSNIDLNNIVQAPRVVNLTDRSAILHSNTCETQDCESSFNGCVSNEIDPDLKHSMFTRVFSRQTINNNSIKNSGTFQSNLLNSGELSMQKWSKINESGDLNNQDTRLNSQIVKRKFEMPKTEFMSNETDTLIKTQKIFSVTDIQMKNNGGKARSITNEDSGMESCSVDSHKKSLNLFYDIKKNECRKPLRGLKLKSTSSEKFCETAVQLMDLTSPTRTNISESTSTTEIPSSFDSQPAFSEVKIMPSKHNDQRESVLPFYEEWFYEKHKRNLNKESTKGTIKSQKNLDDQSRNLPFVAVARMAYIQKYPHELSVSKGERLLVHSGIAKLNKTVQIPSSSLMTNDKLLLVERIELQYMSTHCSRKGLVPGEYLQIVSNSLATHISWFNIDRDEAEKLLLLMGNPSGTYITRPSSDSENTFALSIRYLDQSTFIWSVKHYRIRFKSKDGKYHIFRRISFPTIDQLLAHYTVNADGIACCLTTPYPKNYEPPENLSLLEVNRNNFAFIKKLGQGSFGEVWLATWNNQMSVAIKKLLGNGSMNQGRFLNEAELMHRLNHPNIVRLLAVCTFPNNEPTYIISELMENGSLKQYMQKLLPDQVKMTNLLEMIRDVVRGMMYLEEQHYVHRDLRSSNILVDSKNRLKVADFGLAHVLSGTDEYIGTLHTKYPVRWTAPEGILSQAYSTKSDIWSFGILVYEILTFCELPYKEFNINEVKVHVCSGYRLPRPKLKISSTETLMSPDDQYEIPKRHYVETYMCPIIIYNKLLECWNMLPDKRPSFNSLHYFVEELLEKVTNKDPEIDNN
ncbi:hypothetical protein MN116_001232 [Schistosoma mekongi]|uniref:Tyrosine-protein kinase n=1 Tax=Schistosoma mekongi TaxID=38744 RepID=A0AAE1ZL59_SCHME|nr:hypothetical protein MN116_001232 [Schistosoma mekongi]